jgi:hypothetical protein
MTTSTTTDVKDAGNITVEPVQSGYIKRGMPDRDFVSF